jgi:hypothetical protein
MALERPIVTSRLPRLLEAVDGTTADLVMPGSHDDLARGLLAVAARPGGRGGARRRGTGPLHRAVHGPGQCPPHGRPVRAGGANGTPMAEVRQT